jgi:hypothetical protein
MGALFIIGPKGLKNNKTNAKPAKTNINTDWTLILGNFDIVLLGVAEGTII